MKNFGEIGEDHRMQEGQDMNIRKRLCRERILVLGPESGMKQAFLQVLRNIDLKISEDAEDISPKDYVILFGFSDSDSIANQNFAKGGWEIFSLLTHILQKIETVRPESVLFVSRSDVYGKLFGEFHPVKEDELGYVCHTSAQDQEAARLRMLENLCFRMAREDGIAIKIARFPDMKADVGGGWNPEEYSRSNMEADTGGKKKQSAGQKTDESFCEYSRSDTEEEAERKKRQIAELAVKILLDGAAGEVYNAAAPLRPGQKEELQSEQKMILESEQREESKTEQTTALEPIRIVMDTGKAGRLG